MSNQTRTSATVKLGVVAGLGLLMFLPRQARADHNGLSYGHAEITLGFPNGQVTVGKTWDNHPREVIVEEVTHKYPVEERDEDEGDGGQVIVEKHVEACPPKKVVIIERYVEPEYCDREEVVYVQPPYHRHHDVVVYRRPERVVYAPSRYVRSYSRPVTVIAPHRGNRGHGGHYQGGHVQSQGPSQSHRSAAIGREISGPRNLFPQDQGRPMRSRGVQR